jgi:hypothetical protein
MLKLTPNDDESRYYVSTQNASPRLVADAITLVTEDLILNHVPISKFALIYALIPRMVESIPLKSSHTQPKIFARAQGKPLMFAK